MLTGYDNCVTQKEEAKPETSQRSEQEKVCVTRSLWKVCNAVEAFVECHGTIHIHCACVKSILVYTSLLFANSCINGCFSQIGRNI